MEDNMNLAEETMEMTTESMSGFGKTIFVAMLSVAVYEGTRRAVKWAYGKVKSKKDSKQIEVKKEETGSEEQDYTEVNPE